MTVGGTSDEASGDYYEFNNSLGNTYQSMQAIGSHSTLRLPVDGSGNPVASYSNETAGPCSTLSGYPGYWSSTVPSRPPEQFVRVNYGPIPADSYKGLQYLGSFNANTGLSGGTGNIVEAVFFHEQQCFAGGREYGVFYDLNSNTLVFYSSINTNCIPSICSGLSQSSDGWTVPSGSSYLGGTYYFSIWPVAGGGSNNCTFSVEILNTSFTTLYSATGLTPTNSEAADANFCSSILNEHGHESATVQMVSSVSGLNSSNVTNFTMGLSAIKAGK
jgi:hypothetical protein